MFYFGLFFHCMVFLEVVILFQKKLRKKGTVLGILNLLLTIINLFTLSGTLKVAYSSVEFLKEGLKTHVFLYLLWIIINILYFAYLFYFMKLLTKRNRQNLALKKIIELCMYFFMFYFGIGILKKSTAFIIFCFFVIGIIYTIREFINTKKNYFIVGFLLLTFITWYSYCTDIGSARLSISLMGYPKEAYETGFEELKYFEEKNLKKFNPIITIPLKDGQIGVIDVKTYGILKFSQISKL